MADLSNIKALTWDVGGTVFDWRGTIQDEVRRIATEQEANVDAKQFATDWRVWSFDMLGRVNRSELPWTNLDHIHRQVLDDVLKNIPHSPFPLQNETTLPTSGIASVRGPAPPTQFTGSNLDTR